MIGNLVNTFIILDCNNNDQNSLKHYLGLSDTVSLSFEENSGFAFQNGQIFTFPI